MNRELKQGLLPVKKRIRTLHFLEGIFWGTVAALACTAGILLLSFFTPIEEIGKICILASGTAFLLPSLAGLFMRIKDETAAKRADACFLKERIQSALEFAGESPMEQLLLEDALKSLENLNVKKAFPIQFPRKRAILVGILLLSLLPLFLLENPQDRILEERREFHREMEEAIKKIEEEKPKIEEQLSAKEDKEELRKILNELSESLKESKDPREGLTALARAEQETGELMRKEALNALSDALSEKGLAGLSETTMEAMEGHLPMEALSTELLQAMESMELDPSLLSALEAAAEALEAGDMEALEAAASNISESMTGSFNGDLSALMESLRNSLSASSMKAETMEGASGSASGNSGDGSGSGSVSGNGGNEGNGLGSGNSAGSGTTNQESAGQDASANGSSQSQNGAAYKEGIYETIYDPSRLGLAGESSQLSGVDADAEHVQIEMGPGLGSDAGTVPYKEVIGEYANAAARDAGDPDLPAYVQEWVDGYFMALTE